MLVTQRLMGIGVWVIIIGAWISMYLLYALMTPTHYALQSASPHIQPLLQHMYLPEEAADGTRYRWTQPESAVEWAGLPVGTPVIATVQLADVGAPRELRVNNLQTLIQGRRTIQLLLADTPLDSQQTVTISAPEFTVPGDTRVLGVRLLAVGVALVGPQTLPFMTIISGIWLAGVLALSLGLLRRSWWFVGVIAAPIIVIVLTSLNPLHAAQWMRGLAGVSTIIPVVIFVGRRWIPTSLLVVTSGVFAVRVWGIMYPPFAGHDYAIHLRRLMRFHDGAAVLTDNPYEFGQRVSIILPYYYHFADALSTLVGHHLALHGVMITSETALGVVVWLLVRRAGVSERTAQLAGILTLLWPMSSAVLWWSFMPQITAHLLAIMVAYAAIRQDRRGAYLAAVCLALIATLHVGEFMVAAVWYGLLRISEQDVFRRVWWQRTLPVLAVVPIPVVLYWSIVQSFGGANTDTTGSLSIMTHLNDVLPRMLTAAIVAWQPIPVWAAPIVIGMAVWGLNRLGWAWLGVGVTFWLVELITQAQVRYLYTITPLLASGFAISMMPIWRKGYAGRLFVLCLVGFVAWVSVALWIDGVMGWQKPRVDGLTH